MTSITLSQASALALDELQSGIIDNIITVNQFYQLVPFDGITGNSLAYDRELVLGDIQVAAVGDTITAKNAATYTEVHSTLTTIIGDAEVNGLVQATQSDINNIEALQVASKAKSAGRQFQNMMINGTGSSNQFPGLLTLCDSGHIVTDTVGANGGVLSFETLDEITDLVTDKEGQVDYIVAHSRTVRGYRKLLRSLGGNTIDDMFELPGGDKVIAYSGRPMFRNDWIPVNQTYGASTNASTIFAGTFDDGSRKYGMSGLTAEHAYGLMVEDVGIHQTRDERITRLKWYVSMALFNLNGLAMSQGVLPN